MTLRFRRFLYIFFILLFLILTPLVWLYAAGYKIKNGWQIQKTGMLVLETEPKGAKIFINNEPKQQILKKIFLEENSYITTPAKIKSLLPGKYNIKLEKKNYWPWEKKIEIESGKTTYFENIKLFKNDLPQILAEGQFIESYLSPNKKYVALIKNEQINFLNIEDKKLENYLINKSIFNENFPQAENPWSSDNKKIIIKNLVFDVENFQKPVAINTSDNNEINNLKWAEDSKKIYYSNQEGINYFDTDSEKIKNIIESNSIYDYLIKNNLIYSLEKINQSTVVNIYRIDQNSTVGKINLPPYSYKFINPNHKYINLYDEEYKILYLVDPFSNLKPLVDIINDVNETYWINDDTLLYNNSFEIWMLNLSAGDKKLVIRISSEIKDIIWYPAGRYIIYTTEKNINILEIANDNKCCTTKIIEAESIENISLDKEGETLYFNAKINNQLGFYKLAI